jgi:hypothetical protein
MSSGANKSKMDLKTAKRCHFIVLLDYAPRHFASRSIIRHAVGQRLVFSQSSQNWRGKPQWSMAELRVWIHELPLAPLLPADFLRIMFLMCPFIRAHFKLQMS